MTPERDARKACERWRGRAMLLVFQTLFLLVSLVSVDQPFVSTHNERQNQTYDTARHVFQHGWAAVLSPRASFSLPGYERLPFTVTEQEVPFHGLIGWPFVSLFGHERAIVRLVSTAFALLSIGLMYLIMQRWLSPVAAAIGAGFWATAPLLLQFGQVPMPDILCTAGMLAAFWFALGGRLAWSSVCFLFAILSKSNVLVFGLPVLGAILLSRNCKSLREAVRVSVLWGAAPLAGLVAWVVLTRAFSPATPWTLWRIFSERGDVHLLLEPSFYLLIMACMVIAGVGVLGFLAFVAALRGPPSMDPRLKWALIISNLLYLAVVVQKIPEPQYFLPPLAWMIVASAFGLQPLLSWLRVNRVRRASFTVALILHVVVVVLVTCELKSSRARNFEEIGEAAALLPADARVIAAYRFYGGSAAVWLGRNVIAVHGVDELKNEWPQLQRFGFTHLVILDVDHRYEFRSAAKSLFVVARRLESLCRISPDTEDSADADPIPAIRGYCDQTFIRVFKGNHTALYLLPRNGETSSAN